jgi:hypothetical protein
MNKMKENMGIGRTEGNQAAPMEQADNIGATDMAVQPMASPSATPAAPVGGMPNV